MTQRELGKLTLGELAQVVYGLDQELKEFKMEISKKSDERHLENSIKFERLETKFEKLDQRITEIEKLVWKALGFLAALNLIGEYAIQVAFKH